MLNRRSEQRLKSILEKKYILLNVQRKIFRGRSLNLEWNILVNSNKRIKTNTKITSTHPNLLTEVFACNENNSRG